MNPPKIKVAQAPDYRTINLNTYIGGVSSRHIEVIVYSEERDFTEALSTSVVDGRPLSIKRILQCRLVMEPPVAKFFHAWLGNQIDLYEKQMGKITMPPDMVPPAPPKPDAPDRRTM